MHDLLHIKQGKRLFVTGRTGSGKTQGVLYLLENRKDAVIIIDTKIEPKFETLPRHHVFNSIEAVKFESVRDQYAQGKLQYFIVRPSPEEMDEETLDNFIRSLYEGCRDCTIYIDELYSITNGGDPGPGLIALYTRGRSRGLTTIGCAQRPSWIPVFCMSESDYFMMYSLNWPDDKKRMASMGLGDKAYISLDDFHFIWYDVSLNEAAEFGAVPVSKATAPDRANTGVHRAVKQLRFL